MSADRVMFPLAALFALAAIPGWLILHHASMPVASAWHGHEMLFGYAFSVIAGFLVTRTSRGVLAALVATWIAARVAVAANTGVWAVVAGLSFPATVLAAAAPPLLRGAKRAENRIVPAILVGLLWLDAMWWAGAPWLGPAVERRALLGAIDLLSLLMLVVGGRALPAAVGGHLERHGIARTDMIRSGYELPLAASMAIAFVSDLSGLQEIAGLFSIGAALLTLWRASSWRLGYALRQAPLRALALAYLWLIPALILKGGAQLMSTSLLAHALHGFTIGALGSLTGVMMVRTALLRMGKPLSSFKEINLAVLLLGLSAVLRLLALPSLPGREIWLWASAGAWVVAFAILLVGLLFTYSVPARAKGANRKRDIR